MQCDWCYSTKNHTSIPSSASDGQGVVSVVIGGYSRVELFAVYEFSFVKVELQMLNLPPGGCVRNAV